MDFPTRSLEPLYKAIYDPIESLSPIVRRENETKTELRWRYVQYTLPWLTSISVFSQEVFEGMRFNCITILLTYLRDGILTRDKINSFMDAIPLSRIIRMINFCDIRIDHNPSIKYVLKSRYKDIDINAFLYAIQDTNKIYVVISLIDICIEEDNEAIFNYLMEKHVTIHSYKIFTLTVIRSIKCAKYLNLFNEHCSKVAINYLDVLFDQVMSCNFYSLKDIYGIPKVNNGTYRETF